MLSMEYAPNFNRYLDYSMYHDQAVPDYYGPGSSSGSCYNPTPPPVDHGMMTSDNSMTNNYGYMQSLDQSMNVYHQSPSLWQNVISDPSLEKLSSSLQTGQAQSPVQGKRKGGRKPRDDPNLPPVEKEKRRLRRLRNKEAAAKCRMRRLNHTSELLQQIDNMEKQLKRYENQIAELRQHKEKCEQVLMVHQRDCDKKFSHTSMTSTTTLPNTASTFTSSCTVNARSGNTTPSSTYSSSSLSVTSNQPSINRRKQTKPKLSLDTSCSASHRLSSSSSSCSDLHSPIIMP